VNYNSNAIELVHPGPSTQSHNAQDHDHDLDMDVYEDNHPIDLVDESTSSTEVRGQISELPGIQIVAKPRAKHYQNSVCRILLFALIEGLNVEWLGCPPCDLDGV